MNKQIKFNQIKERRAKRTRAKIFGTSLKPRLTVFRSNRFTYAQLIDDSTGKTLLSASTMGIKTKSKVSKSEALGEKIAELAIKEKITSAVFDRGMYRFHGRVKAIAESAKKAGLKI
ncbi:50S ribosomal protein L18 [Candidatus Wolfebacteria bacterium CG10_big_fil_rev_8_21_14_0_10_31_9]|uniref:Large ribosomal subunit protein uL18 n=1 Tax=Candidatus Wolfebacteria bacterium CG10_big_fil_rev_8_21_14_0_10_31_9 TaxID=1975070 RepID=A0A2H0RC66_9BACT|nr:MAG: 50S ribosomal protein L18 [Candidatus Wolfebacteria bacterium CG10_big_fil_rev_8_21_14_0_10_31_9]